MRSPLSTDAFFLHDWFLPVAPLPIHDLAFCRAVMLLYRLQWAPRMLFRHEEEAFWTQLGPTQQPHRHLALYHLCEA